jgi:hypothetical protein
MHRASTSKLKFSTPSATLVFFHPGILEHCAENVLVHHPGGISDAFDGVNNDTLSPSECKCSELYSLYHG